ncbi:MAG: glycoside hydrolase family 88 protein, partial [Bacteroidota bacterium]|nr:glycoside hydrolase family 88 protein [Bacteroidota bacterium]
MNVKSYLFYLGLVLVLPIHAFSQTNTSYATLMADRAMSMWKDSMTTSGKPAKWSYDQSVILKGIYDLWTATGERRYFDYIEKSMDFFVGDSGAIRTYKPEDLALDNIAPGWDLLLLYNVTGKRKYYQAVQALRSQLQQQPRTSKGGVGHKKAYPSQMWLDGLYMAEPFYVEYARTFHEDSDYLDIARQYILMENHARDPSTGLFYSGYDGSNVQKWADPHTGDSPNFWGRAMGWYG